MMCGVFRIMSDNPIHLPISTKILFYTEEFLNLLHRVRGFPFSSSMFCTGNLKSLLNLK